jgi:hypothetical protein
VATMVRAFNCVMLLALVAAVYGCGASRSQSDCTPVPPADVAVRCTKDDECTSMPPLTVSCGEAKCIAGACQFRPGLTAECPCMPGQIRSCLLPSNESGIQICNNRGGVPAWGPCNPVCATPGE